MIRLACPLVAVDSSIKAIALKVVQILLGTPGSTRNFGDVTYIFPMKMTGKGFITAAT